MSIVRLICAFQHLKDLYLSKTWAEMDQKQQNIYFMCRCEAFDKEWTNMYQRKHKSITTFIGAGCCKRTPSVSMKHCIGKLISQNLANITVFYPDCNRYNLCMFTVACSKNCVCVWIFLQSLQRASKNRTAGLYILASVSMTTKIWTFEADLACRSICRI